MIFKKEFTMIKIPIDPYSFDDIRLYECDSFSFEPGIAFLVGCNGSGKTTLMHQVEQYINYNDDITDISAKMFKCNDSMSAADRAFTFDNNIELGVTILSSSEGERMALALTQAFGWLWAQCRDADIDSVVMLLDSLDSGIDIPSLRMIRKVLLEAIDIAKNEFDTNLYVILSANNYALVENQKCIDIITGDIIQFSNYEDYASFSEESAKKKNNR